jgi:hypothetical protein
MRRKDEISAIATTRNTPQQVHETAAACKRLVGCRNKPSMTTRTHRAEQARRATKRIVMNGPGVRVCGVHEPTCGLHAAEAGKRAVKKSPDTNHVGGDGALWRLRIHAE